MPQPAHPAAVNGLTLAQSEAIADAALAKGREIGLLPLCVVVLDAGGHVKVTLTDGKIAFDVTAPNAAQAKAIEAQTAD